MSSDPQVRSKLVSEALERARRAVDRVDHGLFGLEVLNSTADRRRGPDEWERLRSEADACFVLSTGRTGTMTLGALLGASPAVDAHHEPEPRLIAASYLAWTGVEDEQFWREAVTVARDRLLFGALKRGKLYFEGSNRMTFLADALAAVYPRARFLLVTRRPDGFVRSAVRRGYYQGHPWDHARPRPRGQNKETRAWEARSPEQRCAWLWRVTHEHALAFGDRVGDERFSILHAESLFDGDLDRIERLFAFLGRAAPSRKQLTEVLDRPLNKQKGSFPWGREPAWTDEERDAELRPLADLQARLGYEPR